MDREEIYEMVIREMTEAAVRERNEQSPEEQELQDKESGHHGLCGGNPVGGGP